MKEIVQGLGTTRDIKYEPQEMMIEKNFDDEIVDEWAKIEIEKMERYQELVDRFKECLQDLREKKQSEIRKKEYEI